MISFSNGNTTPESGAVCECVKRDYARIALAFFVYVAVSNAAVFGISLLLSLTGFFDSAFYAANDSSVTAVLSIFPMYLFGIPAFFLVLRGKKSEPLPARNMGFAELLVLFLISRFLVLLGSTISSYVITALENVSGQISTDAATELVMGMPVWLTFLLVVVAAPIAEEFLFRRAVIDRLSGYGRPFAVLFSALIFALAHGNFYQFFYTFLVGLLFGYLYAKTGKITYTIAFHALTNFLGSVAVLPFERLLTEYAGLLSGIEETAGALAAMAGFGLLKLFALYSFFTVRYGVALIGLVLFLMYFRTVRRFAAEPSALPGTNMAKPAFLNVGFLLYFALSVLIFILEF